jgi:succinoglycan biosynthesis transport protein ExoP
MMTDPLDKLTSRKSPFNTRSVLILLRKYVWMILGVSLTVPAIAGYLTSRTPRSYEARASIVIEASVPQYLGTGFRDVVDLEPNWWNSREQLETEFRILVSESQASATAKALCDKQFRGKPALNFLVPDASCTSQSEYDKVAPIIQGILRAEPVKDSRMVYLVTRSTDPDFAALLANTIAQVYLRRNLERRLSGSQDASSWLEQQHGDLETLLRNAEKALLEYKKKHNIVAVAVEDDESEISTKRQTITRELTEIEVRLVTIRAQREIFNSTKWSDPIAEFSPGMADSAVAAKLKEAYMDQYVVYLELRSKYLEKHPAVTAVEARLGLLKSDLTRELEISRKSLDFQLEMLTKQAAELQAALNTTTKEALSLEGRAAEYHRLKREFEHLVTLTGQVGGRGLETNLVSHLRTNNVRFLDAARSPRAPVAPDVPGAVMIGAVAGILLAFALIGLLESLDNTVKSQDDLEGQVGITFLGFIPSIVDEAADDALPESKGDSGDRKRANLRDTYVWRHPKSSVAECCRSIRTNLLFMSPDRPARTLLITSASPQEGKTTVALSLAATLAQSGLSVLLVDTDMRRPHLHQAFGFPSTSEGLSKAIVGETDVFSVIQKTEIPHLSLLPCGASPPNPAELLHAERFAAIVEQLSQRYDRIIFDSPPVGAVTDAAILARITGGTVFVARAGRTSRDALASAVRQVGADGSVNVLGCVINDLNPLKHGGYGARYYYATYGTYYGAGEKESSKVKHA